MHFEVHFVAERGFVFIQGTGDRNTKCQHPGYVFHGPLYLSTFDRTPTNLRHLHRSSGECGGRFA